MSYRYEFFADVHEGQLEIPAEIASRLRLKGIGRVRIVLTTVEEDLETLALRGIDAETIARVATSQSIDPDVATVVLRGEGSAGGSELETRLKKLIESETR